MTVCVMFGAVGDKRRTCRPQSRNLVENSGQSRLLNIGNRTGAQGAGEPGLGPCEPQWDRQQLPGRAGGAPEAEEALEQGHPGREHLKVDPATHGRCGVTKF